MQKKKRAPCLPFLSAAWPSVPLEFQPAQAAEQDLETYGDWGYLYLGNHIIYIYIIIIIILIIIIYI